MRDQHCHDCGRLWAHSLLYDTLADITANVRGRCPWCAWLTKQRRLPLEAA